MAIVLEEPMHCPSEDGKRRYALTDGYYRKQPSDAENYACTCTPSCANPCDGACECVACKTRSLDARSTGDDDHPAPHSIASNSSAAPIRQADASATVAFGNSE
jgi:hypothetical protein